MKLILSIDTSCDETSVAVTRGVLVLSNVISSQIRYHKKFGGVVPFLAQRLHKERIDSVVEIALQRANCTWSDIEAIAVTHGPGLAPALEVGIQKAKDLASAQALPLYPINHMTGHIAACLAQVGERKPTEFQFPALALLVSGGHTELVLMWSFTDLEIVGQTLDDALGEAYDKVAKMLGLGYPGGKLISKMAEEGGSKKYTLPIPLRYGKDLNFSYSGLKNAVRLLIESIKTESGNEYLNRGEMADLAACFEYAAQEAVILKVKMAIKVHDEVKTLFLGGGVAANTALRQKLRKVCRENNIVFMVPPNLKLCTDNAAMIGVSAYLGIMSGVKPTPPENVDRCPSLSL